MRGNIVTESLVNNVSLLGRLPVTQGAFVPWRDRTRAISLAINCFLSAIVVILWPEYTNGLHRFPSYLPSGNSTTAQPSANLDSLSKTFLKLY